MSETHHDTQRVLPEADVNAHPAMPSAPEARHTAAASKAMRSALGPLSRAEWAKTARWAIVVGVPAFVIFSCMNNEADDSFGSHSSGGLGRQSEANIPFVEGASDLNFMDFGVDATTPLAGADYTCVNPFGGGCVPTTLYRGVATTEGVINVTAPKGSYGYSIARNENGESVTTLRVDTDEITAELVGNTVASVDSVGLGSLEDVFGTDEARQTYEEVVDVFGEDVTLDSCMDSVESQGTAMYAFLAEALRDQFRLNAAGIAAEEPEAAELYRSAGEEGSTFVIQPSGPNPIDVSVEYEYQPGEDVTVDGIKLTFSAPEEPCNFDPGAAKEIGAKANDTSFTVEAKKSKQGS